MELLSNLLLFQPGYSGFSSYVRRVIPGLPGHRLLLDGPAGVQCRTGNELPDQPPSSRRLALLQRLSLTQHGVDVAKALEVAGLTADHLAAIYSPYSDHLFALPQIPQVITCHDLIPLHLPNSRKASLRLRHWLPRHLHRARRVIAISGFVADQLLDLGLPSERIRIVPNGIAIRHSHRSGPRTPDVVMLARHDRNKNVLHALRGFSRFLVRRPDWPGSLLVVGRQGRCTGDLQRAVGELGLSEKVRWISGLPEAGLEEVLRTSLALISTSRMEGFNYPVLEAMAAGLPTLISSIPVHHELYEEAALFFRIDDRGEQLAECLERLDQEAGLWKELSRNGIDRAEKYSLQAQQKSIMGVITEMVNSHL